MVHHSCYCNISFEADRLFFLGGSCAVCRARCTGLRGGNCSQSASNCAAREALKPLLRKAARTSSVVRSSTKGAAGIVHKTWSKEACQGKGNESLAHVPHYWQRAIMFPHVGKTANSSGVLLHFGTWAMKKTSIDCFNQGDVLQHFCESEMLGRERSRK